jgi:hypothetical protein
MGASAMSARLLSCSLFVLLGACALRPRYEDLTRRFVPEGAARNEVLVQVLDGNDAPVPGARIEIGDRFRFKTMTDQDGIFRLPLEKRFTEENALVVVVLPQGVKGYQLVTPGSRAQQPPPDAPPAPAEEADAGVTTL